jgi:hypothetical protein
VLFYSNRNGADGIFKQEIGQDTAEPLVTGPEDAILPRLSADGDWILYLELPKTAIGPASPLRLMRIPVSGGVPEFVMEIRNLEDIGCARAPASLCVVSEASQDEKQVTVTAFDPLKGRGRVLRTVEKEPAVSFSDWVSPDGSTLAISKHREAEIGGRMSPRMRLPSWGMQQTGAMWSRRST